MKYQRTQFIYLLLLFSLSLIGSASCQSGENTNEANTNTVTIRSAADNSELAHFEVEIVDEPSERAMGLMFRQELAENAGMLFIFDAPTNTTFWMRNTPLPLDIIFIGEDRRIITIGQGVPFSEAPVAASAPFLYVLEINQGRTIALNISEGDLVEF